MDEQTVEEATAIAEQKDLEDQDDISAAEPSLQPALDVDDDDDIPEEKGCQHCIVRMRYAGRYGEYCAGDFNVVSGNQVVVDCERGLTLGKVLSAKHCESCQHGDCQLPKIDHPATSGDVELFNRNQEKEKEAFQFCQERIVERELPMKLLGVEIMLNGAKAIFYFFSEGRVDFRALVKDLAQRFHTRIEMRQIGVRDGAKILGGLGICGRELCCTGWLTTFEPVSIRMAKDQNLSLNPQKVSGLCGRLMCCLVYEQATYAMLRKGLPKIGKKVLTPDGEGRVREVNVILRQVKVDLNGQTNLYSVDDDGNFNPVVINNEVSKAQPLDSRANRQEALLAAPLENIPMDDDGDDDNDPVDMPEDNKKRDTFDDEQAEDNEEQTADTTISNAETDNQAPTGTYEHRPRNNFHRNTGNPHRQPNNNRDFHDRNDRRRPPRDDDSRPQNYQVRGQNFHVEEDDGGRPHQLNRNNRHHHRPGGNQHSRPPRDNRQQ